MTRLKNASQSLMTLFLVTICGLEAQVNFGPIDIWTLPPYQYILLIKANMIILSMKLKPEQCSVCTTVSFIIML